jgi:DNA-binding transcriptional MerR regulator
MTTTPFTATKLYYKIGEVCQILEVEAYVLRYWETEFATLSPQKNKSGQRTYRPKDIELLLQIRKLLYEDGFTIAGARKQLGHRQIDKPAKTRDADEHRVQNRRIPAARPRKEPLNQVREELENILTLLDSE